MNILNDKNLKKVPFLIVIDKENIKMINYLEKFRKNISNTYFNNSSNDFKCNFQFINFNEEWDLLSLGFIWLCEVMDSVQ